MAVSNRDKLKLPVGESLGFYASALRFTSKYDPRRSFWDNARQVHTVIQKEISTTDPFRVMASEALPPTLMDSLYFQKYDGFQNSLSAKILKQMKWDTTSLGYSITNVGRVGIDTKYGSRELEAVFGPVIYSDVNEKVVGITTVGGRLTFSMTCGVGGLPKTVIEQIRERVMMILEEEFRRSQSV
jgi:hypothetical protein